MIDKITKPALRHKFITAIVLLAMITAGYFGYQLLTKNQNTTKYVMAAVTKGTLVVSVSGSGQVSASNQVDIKPKVSGELLYVGVKNGQSVKAGDLLFQIDSSDAQKAVRTAQTDLETAKLNLANLTSPPDELTLLQSENSLTNAQNNLEQAQNNLDQVGINTEQTLANAYNDGYNSVSSAFLNLPNYTDDLNTAIGTSAQQTDVNVGLYRTNLGQDSVFVNKFANDCHTASDLFNQTSLSFKNTDRSADRATLYNLISDTLDTAKATAQALESTRNMFDAVVNSGVDYKKYYIASTVSSLSPSINSDIAAANSLVSSLQKTKDTIDNANRQGPVDLRNAQLSVRSAQESVREKQLSLDKLNAGASDLDLRSQQISVQQKQDALSTAQQTLANYYIRAPFDGVIANVSVQKGDSVSGTAMANIITQQEIAGLTFNEVDIAKIKTGQKANITFDAIDGLNITGQVVDVDALGTVSQGVVNYGVKIAFDTQDDRVKPGMSLAASIITDVKNDVLSVPNSAIKTQGDSSYVELVSASAGAGQLTAGIASVIVSSNLQSQTIQTGLANDTMTEVTGGLKEGDYVVTQTITSGSTGATQSQSSGAGGFSGGGSFQSILRVGR